MLLYMEQLRNQFNFHYTTTPPSSTFAVIFLPFITVSKLTPLGKCDCGSKNISVCTMLSFLHLKMYSHVRSKKSSSVINTFDPS